MGDQPRPLGSRDPKSHLRKVRVPAAGLRGGLRCSGGGAHPARPALQVLKELSLLRLLKRTNRRILRLHAVAVQCWHSLAAQGVPGLLPLPPR